MKAMKKILLTAAISLSMAGRVFASSSSSGEFVGTREYANYGYVKVTAVVKDGKLVDVRVLESPNHAGRSQYISSVALPWLIQEAVQVQNSRVDLISGATLTSRAFALSLDAALRKAGV